MSKSDWPPALSVTYLIYCIFFYTLTMGGAGYAVFVLDHSGWWILAAFVIASCGYKPHRWHALYTGIDSEKENDTA